MDFKIRTQTNGSIIVLLISLSALAPGTFAQSVVAPLSPSPAVAATNSTGTKSTGVSALGTSFSDLRWGPINFHPHVAYRYLYGDGIQASPGDPKKTAIQTFSPGLLAELGTRWTIDFTPTWTYYSSSAFRNSVNQTGQVNWNTKYEDWTLSAGQTYSKSDSPTVETGRQTQQTSYVSSFSALYALNSRYALQTALSQNLNFTEGYTNTRTWSAGETLIRQISARLNTGLGATYSYTAIDRTPDMASLQFMGNLNWRVTDQLNFALQAGLEKRHIYNQAGDSKQNPVYSGTIQYTPTETTQLGFTASRSSSASFFDSQIVESTSYGLSLNQRLLKRLQFSASLGHHESKYTATQTSATSGRSDKSDSLNLGLHTTFFTRMSTGISYQYSHNLSNTSGFGFSSSQVGLDISASF